MKTCECGCGTEIPYRKKRAKNNQPKFITGHNTRVQNVPRNQYFPTPEEIPSGICECGCGKPTKIVTRRTDTKTRCFRGYPAPRLVGHHSTPQGPEHHLYKGRTFNTEGYVLVYEASHPNAHKRDKQILEHRLVMSQHIGRPLASNEVVHHKNGNKTDNRIENLELMTISDHIKHHNLTDRRHPPKRIPK